MAEITTFMFNITPSITALATVVIAVASLVFTIKFSSREAIRADFDRVTKAIEHVTTGEIAECRHRLANYTILDERFNTRDIATSVANYQNKEYSDNNAVDDAFKIIWALNYVRAVHASLNPKKIISKKSKPIILLEESIKAFVTWHVGPLPGTENKALLIQINDILEIRSGDLESISKWSESIYK